MPSLKGLVVAAAVAGGLALAGCASQGSSACGTTATPVAVPVAAPMAQAACKNVSHCKHKAMYHHHKMHAKHHVVKKKEVTTTESSTSNG